MNLELEELVLSIKIPGYGSRAVTPSQAKREKEMGTVTSAKDKEPNTKRKKEEEKKDESEDEIEEKIDYQNGKMDEEDGQELCDGLESLNSQSLKGEEVIKEEINEAPDIFTAEEKKRFDN